MPNGSYAHSARTSRKSMTPKCEMINSGGDEPNRRERPGKVKVFNNVPHYKLTTSPFTETRWLFETDQIDEINERNYRNQTDQRNQIDDPNPINALTHQTYQRDKFIGFTRKEKIYFFTSAL